MYTNKWIDNACHIMAIRWCSFRFTWDNPHLSFFVCNLWIMLHKDVRVKTCSFRFTWDDLEQLVAHCCSCTLNNSHPACADKLPLSHLQDLEQKNNYRCNIRGSMNYKYTVIGLLSVHVDADTVFTSRGVGARGALATPVPPPYTFVQVYWYGHYTPGCI